MREIHIIVVHHTEIRRIWMILQHTTNATITLSANVRLLSETYIFNLESRILLGEFSYFNIYTLTE